MKIILLKDVPNLGYKNDVVEVKNGYGRNYLIPQRMAIVANRSNLNQVTELNRQTERKQAKVLEELRAGIAKLEAASIKIGAKVGTTEKIFGSVTNVQIADAIKKATGVEIDRRKISVEDDIKTLGTYTAQIDFHRDLKYDLEFEVVAE